MVAKRKRETEAQAPEASDTHIKAGEEIKRTKALKHAKTPKLPTKIGDFTLLPLLLPPLLNLPSAVHYSYLRAHSGSSSSNDQGKEELPKGRTLFVVNLPADCGERELRELGGRWGVVERVVIRGDNPGASGEIEEETEEDEPMETPEEEQEPETEDDDEGDSDAPRPRKQRPKAEQLPKVVPLPSLPPIPHQTALSAHLIFLDPASLSLALRPHPTPLPLYNRPLSGLARYLALHQSLRPSLDLVKEHADSSIALWEQKQQEGKQQSKYKMGEAIVDEDGFTLVKRGGKYGKSLGGGVGVASREFELAHKPGLSLSLPGSVSAAAAADEGENRKGRGKKKKSRRAAQALPDFYRFQVRERKRKEFGELRERFERDKERVREMREGRRFRPY